jgi:hypothetical protein
VVLGEAYLKLGNREYEASVFSAARTRGPGAGTVRCVPGPPTWAVNEAAVGWNV